MSDSASAELKLKVQSEKTVNQVKSNEGQDPDDPCCTPPPKDPPDGLI